MNNNTKVKLLINLLNDFKNQKIDIERLKGTDLKGVCSAKDFVVFSGVIKKIVQEDIPVRKSTVRAVVVGQGIEAIEVALIAKKAGLDVTVLLNGTEKNLPSDSKSYRLARKEGIAFRFLTKLIAIFGDEDGFVNGIGCQEMMLAFSGEGRNTELVPLYNSEFEIEADLVIYANEIQNIPKVSDDVKQHKHLKSQVHHRRTKVRISKLTIR